MLSRESLEYVRRMPPAEKWDNMFEAIEAAWRRLSSLPPEELEKRLAYLRKRHDLSNRLMMERLQRWG